MPALLHLPRLRAPIGPDARRLDQWEATRRCSTAPASQRSFSVEAKYLAWQARPGRLLVLSLASYLTLARQAVHHTLAIIHWPSYTQVPTLTYNTHRNIEIRLFSLTNISILGSSPNMPRHSPPFPDVFQIAFYIPWIPLYEGISPANLPWSAEPSAG